jgi:hypothetical protein
MLFAIPYQFYGDIVAVSKTFCYHTLSVLWVYSGCKQDILLVAIPYQAYGDIVAVSKIC